MVITVFERNYGLGLKLYFLIWFNPVQESHQDPPREAERRGGGNNNISDILLSLLPALQDYEVVVQMSANNPHHESLSWFVCSFSVDIECEIL